MIVKICGIGQIIHGLLAVLLLSGQVAASQGDPTARQEDNDRIRVCREAWRASLGTPPNGKGACHYTMTKNKTDLVVADAIIEVNGDNYRIEAKVHTHYITKSLASRVIIREPGTVFLADFTTNNVLMGSHVLQERHRALPPELTDWVFSPLQPLVQVDPLKLDSTNTKRTGLTDNGDIELYYSKHPIYMKIVCEKDRDYNVGLCATYLNGFDGPIAAYEAVKWQQINSRWFVKEVLRVETMWKDGKKGDELRQVMSYREFDPSYLPSKDRFSLESVGLKKGSRIQDRRPSAAHPDHYYEPLDEKRQEPSLASTVDRLPGTVTPRPWFRKTWFRWAATLTGVALLTVGMIALYRRRNRLQRRTGPNLRS